MQQKKQQRKQRTLAFFLSELEKSRDIEKSTAQLCLSDLKLVMDEVSKIIKEKKDPNLIREQVIEWKKSNDEKLKSFANYQNDKSDDFLREIICNIMLGIYVAFNGKIPRETQLICLWLNMHSTRNILQVKTGQGKTMIVAMTALYHALRGKKVDIFTSSAVLAETETRPGTEVYNFYTLFGITVGNNCSSLDEETSMKAYKNQIIYGTSFNFQADYLKKIFSGKIRFFQNREFDSNHVAILDEVDALLIDRMRDSTRLSSPKPLYQVIKLLLVLIYQVKQELQKAKNKFGGGLKVFVLGTQIKNLNIENLEDQTEKDIQEYKQEQINQIKQIIVFALENDLKTLFPKYLLKDKSGKESYIYQMLKVWIKNSYGVSDYQQNIHYVKSGGSIIPVDLSTGTYQRNTKWADGIHQFVELENNIEPSVDSLVTNYESNLIFFQRYQSYLYGLTGTIANALVQSSTKAEKSEFQEFLESTYELKIRKIPTFKERILYLEYPRIMTSTAQWTEVLIDQSQKYSDERQVLLIFQNIKEAESFIFQFQKRLNSIKYRIVQLFDHDEYEKTMDKLKVMKQQGKTDRVIIVSTNLGGRGTDYQVMSKQIQEKGGIHVMMTYFAQNWRIQQQAFGRAGRNSQPGSGAFYIDYENLSRSTQVKGYSIYKNQEICNQLFKKLIQGRDKILKKQFQQSKISIKNQCEKRRVLDLFKEKYIESNLIRIKSLEDQIQRKKWISCSSELCQKYELEMEISLVQEQWGLYLKQKIPDNSQKQENLTIDFNEFVTIYDYNKSTGYVNPGIIAATASKMLKVNQKKAKQLFETAISQNENWISQYYLLYLDLKQQSNKNRQITQGFANKVINKIKKITKGMIGQMCLNLAIKSHYESKFSDNTSSSPDNTSSSSDKTPSNLENVYMNQINNLMTISNAFKDNVINQSIPNLRFNCSFQNINHSISELSSLGYNYSIKLQFYKIVEEEKKGFWDWVWSGIKAIGFAIVTVATAAILTVATPIIGIIELCRGNDPFQAISKVWSQYGACVGLISSQLFASKKIKEEVGMRLGSASKPKLIEIVGDYNLDEESSKKMMAFRKKMQEKSKQIKLKQHIMLTRLSQLDPSKDMLKREQLLIETIKDQGCVTIQQIEKKAHKLNLTATVQYIQNNNVYKKVQKIQQSLQSKIQDELKKVHTQLESFANNVHAKMIAKMQDTVDKINSMPQTNHAEADLVSEKINQFKLMQVQQQNNTQKLIESVQKQVQNSLETEKYQFKTANLNLTSKLIQISQIKSYLKCLQESTKQCRDTKQQFQQIQELYHQKNILIHRSGIINNEYNMISLGMEQARIKGLEALIRKNASQQGEKLSEQEQNAQATQLQQYTNKIMNARKTPLTKCSQINNFIFLKKMIQSYCRNSKIACYDLSIQQFTERIRDDKREEKVLVTDGMVCFMTDKECIVKIYEKNDTLEQQLVSLRNIVDIVQYQQIKRGNSSKGIDAILDIKKYLAHVNECQDEDATQRVKDLLSSHQEVKQDKNCFIKKQFLTTIFMEIAEKLLQRQYPKIVEDRKKKGVGSLPLTFLPVQLGTQTKQWNEFLNKAMNSIAEVCSLTSHQQKSYKTQIFKCKTEAEKSNFDEINHTYTDYKCYITPKDTKKKKVR